MSKSEHKKARDTVLRDELMHCKSGGPMRDRRDRRAKEKKHAWKKEEH